MDWSTLNAAGADQVELGPGASRRGDQLWRRGGAPATSRSASRRRQAGGEVRAAS